jgi:hypothetical protein
VFAAHLKGFTMIKRNASKGSRAAITCGLKATIKLTNGTPADYKAFLDKMASSRVNTIGEVLTGVNQFYFNVERSSAAGTNAYDMKRQLNRIKDKLQSPVSVEIESCVRTNIQPRIDPRKATANTIKQIAEKVAKDNGLSLKTHLIEFE